MNRRHLDLNVLPVLDALLQERSVTRAAKRMHLAQPTVSNILARLRDYFGDPLLVRDGREMRPTHKAHQLMRPLRNALEQIDKAIADETQFDPAISTRTIKIATTDYITFVLLPPLLTHIEARSPGIKLAVTDLDAANPYAALTSGEVDLVIGALPKTIPSLHQATLFTDHYVCAVRNAHPTIQRHISKKQFLQIAHMTVRQQHGGVGGSIDDALSQMQVARKVAISLPHLFSASYAILSSDFVLTLPARVGEKLSKELPLKVLKHPLALKPFAISQLWHDRSHTDPAHVWFRDVLVNLAR